MADISDGEVVYVQGSAAKPYELKNSGGVYSCTCPAWMHQSTPIERRTCKHLRKHLGDDFETARVGAPGTAPRPPPKRKSDDDDEPEGTAPPILLAHSWKPELELVGWWMSEKLDGVRAYWTGREFLSRLGNKYHAPKWFTDGLPDFPLDGELWCGRKLFQKTVSVVRRQDQSRDWEAIKYVVFDAPAAEGVFEERSAIVARLAHPYAAAHPHARCESVEHLKKELARVEALGGEGLMLRQPRSKYEVGRSFTLLKVKSFHDAEAKVVAHLPGTGKHKGRLGALDLELPNGTRFSVGTGFSDAERADPPPIGAIVTFRYQELSDAGVPRFPSYVGVRHDVDFEAAKPKKPMSAAAEARKRAIEAARGKR